MFENCGWYKLKFFWNLSLLPLHGAESHIILFIFFERTTKSLAVSLQYNIAVDLLVVGLITDCFLGLVSSLWRRVLLRVGL